MFPRIAEILGTIGKLERLGRDGFDLAREILANLKALRGEVSEMRNQIERLAK